MRPETHNFSQEQILTGHKMIEVLANYYLQMILPKEIPTLQALATATLQDQTTCL